MKMLSRVSLETADCSLSSSRGTCKIPLVREGTVQLWRPQTFDLERAYALLMVSSEQNGNLDTRE